MIHFAQLESGAIKIGTTVELPDDDYTAVKEVARSNGLSVAAYIRMAILQRVRRDRAEAEGGGK